MKNFRILVLVLLVASFSSCSSFQAAATDQEMADVQIDADKIKRDTPQVTDPRVTNYISDLGKKIAAAVPTASKKLSPKIEFFTFNAIGPSSFSVGRYVFLERAEIEKAKSEGEIAGVLGHEIAHIYLGHVIFTSGYDWCMDYLDLCENKHYQINRELELEADALAVITMAKAGYDPEDLAQNFLREAQILVKFGESSYPTHPSMYERIRKIRELAKTLKISKKPIKDTGSLKLAKKALKKIPSKTIWFK